MSTKASKKSEDKDILEKVKANFDDYCDIADEAKKEEMARIFKQLFIELVLGRLDSQIATKGGAYSFDAIIKRANMTNVIATRNALSWFKEQIEGKYNQRKFQYQGDLYNPFADRVALNPLMVDDKKFDNCCEKNDCIPNNEIKSSQNTTNDGSLNSALRKLRRNEEVLGVSTDKPIVSTLCILNADTDAVEIVTCTGKGQDGKDNENADLRGFRYLKISGLYAWRWLFGVDGPDEIMAMCMDIWSCDLAEYHLGKRLEECMETYERKCKKAKLDPKDKMSIIKLSRMR